MNMNTIQCTKRQMFSNDGSPLFTALPPLIPPLSSPRPLCFASRIVLALHWLCSRVDCLIWA